MMTCDQPQAHPDRCGCGSLSAEDEIELRVAERTADVFKELDSVRNELKTMSEQFRIASEQINYLRKQRIALRQAVTALKDAADGNYWAWQGDGTDNLETLTAPVLITPDDLLKIINGESRE